MQTGKPPLDVLARLLSKVSSDDPRVVLGPQPGEDAAIIDMGDRYLVATADPITFATDQIGWYAVQVSMNDVAVTGATPTWMLATLLVPPNTSPAQIEEIFDQMGEACSAGRISLVGGHTEVTDAVSRPILSVAMLGEASKDRIVRSRDARVDDAIVMTESIAIEGTAILAREAGDILRDAGVPADVIAGAGQLLFSPGIGVTDAAKIANQSVQVHAMHDPTEGGLATGLLELASSAGVGVEVDEELVPILPACRRFCAVLGLDPWGLLASGSLIAAIAPDEAPRLVEVLQDRRVAACVIGRITTRERGLKLKRGHMVVDLPTFTRDELARFLDC